MDELLGRLDMEAPMITDSGEEGTLEIYERGIKFKLPGDRGSLRAFYKDIERMELEGGELPLGRRAVKMRVVTPIGEVFDLSFIIPEGYYYVLKRRMEGSR